MILNSKKIIVYSIISISIFSFYWFIYRNREPFLNLVNIDWLNKIVNLKFGNTKKSISLGNNGKIQAGSTFSNDYQLEFKSEGLLMIFYVFDKKNNLIFKQTLDFGAKLIY